MSYDNGLNTDKMSIWMPGYFIAEPIRQQAQCGAEGMGKPKQSTKPAKPRMVPAKITVTMTNAPGKQFSALSLPIFGAFQALAACGDQNPKADGQAKDGRVADKKGFIPLDNNWRQDYLKNDAEPNRCSPSKGPFCQNLYSTVKKEKFIAFNQDLLMKDLVDKGYLVEISSDEYKVTDKFLLVAGGGDPTKMVLSPTFQDMSKLIFNILTNAIEYKWQEPPHTPCEDFDLRVRLGAHLENGNPVKTITIEECGYQLKTLADINLNNGEIKKEIPADYNTESMMLSYGCPGYSKYKAAVDSALKTASSPLSLIPYPTGVDINLVQRAVDCIKELQTANQ